LPLEPLEADAEGGVHALGLAVLALGPISEEGDAPRTVQLAVARKGLVLVLADGVTRLLDRER
jgi:hypothetical protein